MNALPQRTPRPTRARCPECGHVIALYRMISSDHYRAHTVAGVPLVESDGTGECIAGGWHVEDDEVVG